MIRAYMSTNNESLHCPWYNCWMVHISYASLFKSWLFNYKDDYIHEITFKIIQNMSFQLPVQIHCVTVELARMLDPVLDLAVDTAQYYFCLFGRLFSRIEWDSISIGGDGGVWVVSVGDA